MQELVVLTQYFLFKGACASQSFQCYDQRCIPKSRVCDGFIDCYGKLHEDENRCTSGSEKTCADSLSQAKFKDGIYLIHLGTKSKIFIDFAGFFCSLKFCLSFAPSL